MDSRPSVAPAETREGSDGGPSPTSLQPQPQPQPQLGAADSSIAAAPRSWDPFDARVSGKEPFPAFEAALDRHQEDKQHGDALNWSIDTLAELKPVAFSPLPEQKAAHGDAAARTPGDAPDSHSFFEDEQQYSVLRTPVSASASLPPRTPSSRPATRRLLASPSPLPVAPSTPLELHRRCRETIAHCEAQMRERQRKMERLHAALPASSRPARSPRHGQKQQQRQKGSTPPRAVKRNRRNGSASAGMRQLRWSASPIAPAAAQTPGASTPTTATSADSRMSFGLSPIAPPSPERSERNSPKLSGFEAVSAGKENEAFQPQAPAQEETPSCSPGTASASSSSTSPVSPPCGASNTSAVAAATSRFSIPRRQRAFMAAMAAEADDAPSGEERSGGTNQPKPAAAASPILALYHEAKQLGVTDPQAQWEYVQLLLRKRRSQRR